MRARMLKLLNERPMNAHQLTKALGVNYRTVMHHLNILLENGLVVAEGPKYGTLYFPSKTFIEHSEVFMKTMEGQIGFNKRRRIW
jgi:DNA-binding transcriptional ArsR family regulator